MRVACIYLPSFPLQVHVRLAPHRAGTAFAVAEAPSESERSRPSILVCSRAAWELGVRPEMTATQARALAPEVDILTADPPLYREALEALAEVLMHRSVTVDIGSEGFQAQQSIYLRVPRGSRGDSFGGQIHTLLGRHGYRGRVGVADDRFTAWAAAMTAREPREGTPFSQECTSIPCGGAAAFLAPLSIDLLPLPDDIRHMLQTLGVHTLGDFAALPPPSVGRRWSGDGVDYQKLARGDGPAVLTGFSPRERIVESIDLDDELTDLEPLSFLLRPLADRACDRLRGRSAATTRVALRLRGRPDERTELILEPSRPTLSGRTLLDLARARLQDSRLDHPVTGADLIVLDESEPELDELDLFDHRDGERSPEALDIAIARIESMFGSDAASSAEVIDSHRPERAFRLKPFEPGRSGAHHRRSMRARRRRKRTRRSPHRDRQPALPLVLSGMVGALRLVDPPQPLSGELHAIDVGGTRAAVVASRGPTRLDAEWWSDDPVERDYYEVETEDGGRYWVFRKKSDGRFYLHGIFD